MHIRSKRRQEVNIREDGYSVAFEESETIWTESCHKYTRVSIRELAGASGFQLEGQWVDSEWPFAETLLLAR